MNILYALYEIFLNLISAAIRHDYHNYSGKNWNQSESECGRYNIIYIQ